MPKFESVDEYIESLAEPMRSVATKMQVIIDASLPKAEGVVWHGHPVWKVDGAPAVLIKAQSSSVTFGFFQGGDVADASGRLVLGSSTLASVKLQRDPDIDEELFMGWLRQVGLTISGR